MKTKYEVIIKNLHFEILKIRESSHNFPIHIHKKMCVGKIDSGEKCLLMNGKNYILRKNDLFFIPSYMPHAISIENGKTVSYTILCVDDIKRTQEEMIINNLFSSSLEVKSIHSLYKLATTKVEDLTNRDNMINKILKYIDENYMEQLSIDLLAEIIDLSPYYLLHLFKEKIGLSLHQYIIQTRIKKTKEHFLSGENILDIALNSGFYDQSHYIRNFKTHVGITPQKYFDSMVVL